MKKRLLLLASAAFFSAAAFAQAVIADSTAVGLVGSTTSAALEAGTLIGSNDAISLSIGTPDTYKKSSTYVSPYSSIVINGEEISTGYGIQGSNDAKDANGKKPAALYVPSTGTSYQLDAKKDGYAVVWSKLNTDKKFVVFEEGTAIGYSLTMQVDTNKVEYTLEGSGDNNALTSSVSKISALSGYSGSAVNGLGVLVFPISANKSYIIAGDGTKMTIGGVSYSADDNISVVLKGKDIETTLLEAKVAANVLEYTISPVAGEDGTVSSIIPVVVTFPNATKIEKNESAGDDEDDEDDEDDDSLYAPAKASLVEAEELDEYDFDYGEGLYKKGTRGWTNYDYYTTVELGSNTITYTLNSKYDKEGQFALYIPAGSYLIDGVENKLILEGLTYAKASETGVSISPATASNQDSLKSFVITFAGEVAATITGSDTAPTLTSSATGSTTIFGPSWIAADGNKLTLTLPAAVYYVGTYTLTLPAGSYTVAGVAGEALTFTYKVVASDKTREYTISPVADAEGNVSTISPIVVTFPNVLKVTEDDFAFDQPTITVDGESAKFTTTLENNNIILTIDEASIKTGKYSVTIPSGTYELDGTRLDQQITATFNYVAPVQDYAVVLPGEGEVEGLQSFTIEFPNATQVATNFSREACPTLYSVAGGYNVATFTSGTVDGNKLTLSINSAITTLGEYELRIPGASYLLDSVAGQDLTYKYTIVASAKTQEYAIDSVVTTLSPIVLTFPNVETIANATEDDLKDVLELEHEGLRGTVADVISEVQISGNQLLIFVQDADDAIDGTYTLHLYDGILLLDGVENDEITATFTYTKPVVKTLEYTIIPEVDAEGKVSSISPIVITFPNATKVDTTDVALDITVTYAGRFFDADAMYTLSVQDRSVYITIDDADIQSTTYTLTIPAGAFLVDGVENEEIVKTFIYEVKVPEFTLNVTPDSATKVASVETIVIAVEGEEVESVSFDLSSAYFYALDAENDNLVFADSVAVEDNKLVIYFNTPITTAGTYTVYISANVITINGVKIQDMQTITFTVDPSVTGINSIVNNAAVKGAIYNLRGVKMDRNNLVPGIYVIDGKKVQLR